MWFTALEGVYGSALLAHGRSQWTAAANATRTGAIAVLMPIGFALGGFSGAVAGFSISSVGMYLVSAMACRPLGLSAWRSDLWLSVYIALVGSLGLAIEDKAASLDLPPLAIFADRYRPLHGGLGRARLARLAWFQRLRVSQPGGSGLGAPIPTST